MLSNNELKNYIMKLKGKTKVYTPLKYFKGLSTFKEVSMRYRRILKGVKEFPNFTKFKTDERKPTKKSKYTIAFEKEYNNAKSIKQKSKVTGIPLSILKKVYEKGLAAWGSGHRVGASGQQWGYARVHSFIMLGCTSYTADKYLLKEALILMSPKHIDLWKRRKTMCPTKKTSIF
jgi:hypothetical protein